ncbi:MAG: lactate utilization protein [Deltaproteobacteria bacterium]|nr:lactate utilization protein [Deltaproteobacteria bacterium]
MSQRAREEILGKLKGAPKAKTVPRPYVPPLTELSWNGEQLIANFTQNLTAQTGVVHRVKDSAEAKAKLAEIFAEEGLTTIMASTDAVVAPLDLRAWGKEMGVRVLTAGDFADRDAYKNAVFTEVQAGVTGADYGVAESGTIGLIHDRNQPRLISIAPITHIALLPVGRLFPVYESVTERVFGDKNKLPGQFTFTTGPSMTGDIQGGQFKGMHGPRKLIVILIG